MNSQNKCSVILRTIIIYFFKFVKRYLPNDRNKIIPYALTTEHGQPPVFIKEVASPVKICFFPLQKIHK